MQTNAHSPTAPTGVHLHRSVVNSASAGMKTSVFRPVQVVTFGFLALVVLALVISALLTLREQQRLQQASERLEGMHEFERIHLLVTRRLVTFAEGTGDDATAQREISEHVEELIELSVHPATPDRLETFRLRVQRTTRRGHEEIHTSLLLFEQVGATEAASQAALLERLHRQAGTQLKLEIAAPLAVLALGVLLIPITRRRIIKPLERFGRQLSRLADGEFTPAPMDEVDPLLLPLHRQFNELAGRLAELEAEHKARTESLQEEVRGSTRALLEQQRSLARAERLAATGELAASVAHELRNPLAGVQMTLSNLRADARDPDLVERIDLVADEVTRLTRLLNELLDSARHAPEQPRAIELAKLVEEMLALTRCQLTPEIRLESRVDPELTCRLPRDRLRQALLNLILNSAAALGERGGTVTIEALSDGQRLEIAVRDDGPGFPPDILERGIRSFLSTRLGGTGLGLAMVRRFARDLGGEVTLANSQPHGARVTVVLPLDADRSA